MATTSQVTQPAKAASPIALWNLLSLDAPTVAVLWLWFVARACHVRLPLMVLAAMAVAVWMLYVADRLLDVRRVDAGAADGLEARHLFHYHHRRSFMAGMALVTVALPTLLTGVDPTAMRFYLIVGALLISWFVVLHANHSKRRLPKEIVVGLFFSAAIFVPTLAREPALRASLLPDEILFAALCSLNCMFIYAWEHDGPASPSEQFAHFTTRVAVVRLPAIAVVTITGASALALFGSAPVRLIASACALAAGFLLVLHCNRHRLSRNDLRAAADMALLSPMLLLPFLR